MTDVLYDYITLGTRHESRNHTFTLDSAFVSLEATDMASLPCVMIAASSAYISTPKSGQTSGRSFMYKENSKRSQNRTLWDADGVGEIRRFHTIYSYTLYSTGEMI